MWAWWNRRRKEYVELLAVGGVEALASGEESRGVRVRVRLPGFTRSADMPYLTRGSTGENPRI